MDNILFIKSAMTGAIALISIKFGILFPLLIIFALAMLIDFISGWIAASVEGINNPTDPTKGLKSSKSVVGIFKKLGYILAVCVAFMLDWIILNTMAQLGFTVPVVAIFGVLTLVWFILNEMLSIIENLGRASVKLPAFLVQIVTVLKGKVDSVADSGTTDLTKTILKDEENKNE